MKNSVSHVFVLLKYELRCMFPRCEYLCVVNDQGNHTTSQLTEIEFQMSFENSTDEGLD